MATKEAVAVVAAETAVREARVAAAAAVARAAARAAVTAAAVRAARVVVVRGGGAVQRDSGKVHANQVPLADGVSRVAEKKRPVDRHGVDRFH